MDPIGTSNAIALTEELNGSRTEGGPSVGVFCLLLWSGQRFAHQIGPHVFGVPIPCIGKVAKSGPRIFSLADLRVSPHHGLNGCRHDRHFSLPFVIDLRHGLKGFRGERGPHDVGGIMALFLQKGGEARFQSVQHSSLVPQEGYTG